MDFLHPDSPVGCDGRRVPELLGGVLGTLAGGRPLLANGHGWASAQGNPTAFLRALVGSQGGQSQGHGARRAGLPRPSGIPSRPAARSPQPPAAAPRPRLTCAPARPRARRGQWLPAPGRSALLPQLQRPPTGRGRLPPHSPLTGATAPRAGSGGGGHRGAQLLRRMGSVRCGCGSGCGRPAQARAADTQPGPRTPRPAPVRLPSAAYHWSEAEDHALVPPFPAPVGRAARPSEAAVGRGFRGRKALRAVPGWVALVGRGFGGCLSGRGRRARALGSTVPGRRLLRGGPGLSQEQAGLPGS